MRNSTLLIGLLVSTVACESASSGDDAMSPLDGAPSGAGGLGAAPTGAEPSVGAPTTGGTVEMPGAPTSGTAPGAPEPGPSSSAGGTGPNGSVPESAPTSDAPGAGGTSSEGMSSGGTSSGGAMGSPEGSGGRDLGGGGEPAAAGAGGVVGAGGQGGETGGDTGGETGGAGGAAPGVPNNCTGAAWPSANPTSAGPFQVTAEKNVGPLAGVVPDPIYGERQQRFNVYRPTNLANSGYCHPILIWANGFRDNPEQNPPDCIVDSGANRWCGQYLPLLNHLASHGFVVVAPLSTATAEGDPLPTIAGLDWILEQTEDPSSAYYQRLDTANIGQLGHSYGGMSTCMSASEPRYKALATICGTRALTGVRTPMLFFCGGRDSTVSCDSVRNTYLSVTDQPAFYLNERDADHGSWVYQGANGVSLSSAAAWFRVHLMDDTENRRYFYGPNCTFCTDNRVEAEQNSLMAQ